jgi:hypothetical protein
VFTKSGHVSLGQEDLLSFRSVVTSGSEITGARTPSFVVKGAAVAAMMEYTCKHFPVYLGWRWWG